MITLLLVAITLYPYHMFSVILLNILPQILNFFLLHAGWYYLKTDFTVQGVRNISIIGNHSTIQCANSSFGIAIINVTNIVVQNLEISKCGKNHSNSLAITYTGPVYDDMPKLHWRSAILLHYCVSVVIAKVSVSVDIGTDGMLVVNALSESKIDNVHVTTITPDNQNVCNATTNGIIIYYHESSKKSIDQDVVLYIQNFTYRQKSLNPYTEIQTVLYILLDNVKYKVLLTIYDCEYRNLHNVSILYYISYRNVEHIMVASYSTQRYSGHRNLLISNLTVYNCSGNHLINLLVFKYHSCWVALLQSLSIYNSKFYNNININSVITIDNSNPCLTKQSVVSRFHNCSISFNQATNLISINERLTDTNDWSVVTLYHNCSISSNNHKNGNSVIVLNAA